jgi:DNA polymerase III subunit gamma/tau
MAGDAAPDAARRPDDAAGQPNLALYRKYRPATFAEVKGQDHVTQPLRQALAHGRVHHAYLFSGPRGCGKTSSARILARSLNCERGPTPDPCGRCESCVALAPNGPGSIDVIEIDAASHGGVDDARDLRERAFYAPVSGHFKIYIIDEAHMVTREGFNALLKLVEEPPPHLKFVFATTEPDKVVSTIRSRTHHYPFRLVPPQVLRELLEQVLEAEGVRYEPTALPVVIRAGAGSVRDTLSVLDQLLAGSGESGISYADAVSLLGYTDAGLLDETVDAFAAADGAAVFHAVDRAIQAGHDPRRFAADLLDRLRDLIVLGAVEDAAGTGLLDAPADQMERMREQAAKFGAAELTRAAEVLNTGLTEMRGATSPRLLLELTCARVLLPGADGGEAALLARLERLERGAALGAGPAPAAQTAPAAQPAPAAQRAPAAQTAPVAQRAPTAQTAQPAPAAPATPAAPAAEAARPREAQPPTGGAAPAAGPERPARATDTGVGAGAGTGSRPDAESLRRSWDAILDAVKKRRRVSWILLGNATVRDVEGNTVTLEFARDGELKGFSTSGSDALLADVLHELFGVKWRIAAVPAGGRDQQESSGLATSQADRVTERIGRAGPGRDPRGAGPAGAAGTAGRAGPQDRATADSPAGGSDPALAEDEVDPGSDADAGAELTGMELIQRELGGQVIGEIEDS